MAALPLNEENVLSIAHAHPLLRVLDAPVLRQVVRASQLVPYREKRTILREGDAPDRVFCLLKGSVRVFHRQGDSEVLLKLFGAPALFGEMEVLAERPFLEYVTTLEPSEVLLVPAQVFRQIVKTQAAFAAALSADLSARLCISAHNQKALAFCDVDTRLANLFLDYAELFGERVGSEIRLSVALSQEGMAKDLAVTRKALGSSLKKFKEEGLVDKRDARYVITNVPALKLRGYGTLSLSYKLDRPLPQERKLAAGASEARSEPKASEGP